MIKIKNLKKSKPNKKYDFRVDRASPIGNPFFITENCNREQSIKKYEKYFYLCIENKSPFFINYLLKIKRAYKKYGKVRLFCWCAPLDCHAKIIKQYIKRITK